MTRHLRVGLLLEISLLATVPVLAAGKASASDSTARVRAEKAFGNLPLAFEENRGQTDARVRFLSRVPGYTLFLTRTGAVLSAGRPAEPISRSRKDRDRRRVIRESVGIRLVGANPKTEVIGTDELPGKSNYFVSDDPSRWHTDVPTYRRVRYSNVYPGIDLIYYGTGSQLEFDFVVAPGADPSRIRLAYDGARRLKRDPNGDVVAKTRLGEIRLKKPAVYQAGDPARTVDGRFRLQGSNRVAFRIGSYDRQQPLTIDPVLSYGTLIGPVIFNSLPSVTIDGAGNAYVVGLTAGAQFPVTPGAYETTAGPGDFPGFVLKLNPTASALVYSTYLGTFTAINAVAVDGSGNAYLTGRAFDPVPTTPGAYRPTTEMFVTKLNATGSALLYSTGLGSTGGSQEGMGIVVDALGQVYVTGNGGVEATPGAFQSPGAGANGEVFVAKLDAAGADAIYACNIGGDGNDNVAGIAVDGAGAAYIEGNTNSANFPTTPGAYKTCSSASQDVFVTKVNSGGSALAYSTCIAAGFAGGAGTGGDGGIDVDSSGNAYITGGALSGYPVTPGAFNVGGGVFVTKVNTSGTGLVYSSVFGGTFGSAHGMAMVVDRLTDEALVAGFTTADDFPLLGAFQSVRNGQEEAFLTRLNGSGTALVYSTYLGGTHDERALSVALAPSGVVYVAGIEGGISPSTDDHGFPLTPGAFNTCTAGVCFADNAFVARILPLDAPDMAIAKSAPATVAQGSNLVYTITVSNVGSQDAANVTVTDATPTGLTFVSNSGACTTSFPCSLGTVAHGASATITSTFTVPAGYFGPNPIVNTASVSTSSPDSSSANDTATASSRTGADLLIAKTGPAGVTPGSNLVYTIVVTNNGPSDATAVSVADPTPPGLTFVSNTGACTTPFPCALGLMANGATATITSTFAVPAGYTTPNPIVNTATVATTSSDPTSTNNTATASTTTGADVSITKTGPANVSPGTNLVYTIRVSNAGPANAANVSVADTTPAGLTFVSNSGGCATAFPCNLGTVTAGQTVTITSTFSVPAGYTAPFPIVNTATASTSSSDPNVANNTATASTPNAGASANMSVTKTAGSTQAFPGNNVTYTITVSNAGPANAPNVTVSDATPAGLTFVSNSGACTTAFPCALGTVSVGQTRTITATYSIPVSYGGANPIVNSATVSSGAAEPNSANNTSIATVALGPPSADVGVTIIGPNPIFPGGTAVYTITVRNYGPSTASNVRLTSFVADLSFRSNSGACVTAFPCSLGSMESGQVRTIVTTYSAPTYFRSGNSVVNTVAVTSLPNDPRLSNNQASFSSPVDRAGADIVVSGVGPALASPGSSVTYTWTLTNAGPREAFKASLSVPTPAGLSFVSNSGDCATAFPCVFGTLAPGQTRSVVTTFTVPSGYVTPNPIVVTASGYSTSFDPSFANNSASAATPLDVPAPARVLVTRWPAGIVQRPGVGGATDTYVLTNVGGTPTSITLSQSSSFFSQSPSSFALAPGASQAISLAGVAEPAGGYNGWSFVSGDGVARGTAIPVALLAASASGSGVPRAASARLSLVARPEERTGSGPLTFTNEADSPVNALLLSDAPWLLPPVGLVEIPAHGSRTVNLTINRTQRPDAAMLGGTLNANVWLITSNGVVRVTVADTVRTPSVPKSPARAHATPTTSDATLRLFLPGVTHAANGSGERDVDLWLTSPTGASSLAVDYTRVQRCESECPTPPIAPETAATTKIGPYSAGGLFVADAAWSLFGKSSEEGTLQFVAGSEDVRVAATLVSVTASPGSANSLIPALRSDRALNAGESQVLSVLGGDGPATIHLFLQETAGSSGSIRAEWLDARGGVLAARIVSIGATATLKMSGTAPVQGAALRITNTSSGAARVLAYSRRIEAGGDSSTSIDWGRQFDAGAGPWLVPLVGAVQGANGSSYRSDFAITSGGGPATGVLQYFAGDSVQSARISLDSGATDREIDIARGLFQRTGDSLGYLVFLPDGSPSFGLAARTVSTDQAGRAFGADLPFLPSAISLGAGGARRIAHLEDASAITIAAKAVQTFRTNLGLIEAAGGTATVRLSLLLPDGTVLGSRDVPLQPRQFVSLPRAAASILGESRDANFGDLHDIEVRFEVVSGTGAVIPFASSVENATNDFLVRIE